MSRSGLGGALGMSDRRRALGIVAIFLFVIAAYTQLIEPLIFRFDQALEKGSGGTVINRVYPEDSYVASP